MMDCIFLDRLDDEISVEVENFYKSSGNNPIEQNIWWNPNNKTGINARYFLARENGILVCFAIIEEEVKSIFKFATLRFGPVYSDFDALVRSVKEIIGFYKSNRFVYLKIQPNIISGFQNDYFENLMTVQNNVSYKYNGANWSSLRIDLDAGEETVFRNFSKGHKSAIKASQKKGVVVKSEDISAADLRGFAEVYVKMWAARKKQYDVDAVERNFNAIGQFGGKTKLAKQYIVLNSEQKVIGGITVVMQSDTVRYFSGAADPEFRDLGVLHAAIWEAIKAATRNGFHYFDLWGYNHFVKEGDEIFNINRFKKGFGGEFVFYSKLIFIIFRPLLYSIFQRLLQIRSKLK